MSRLDRRHTVHVARRREFRSRVQWLRYNERKPALFGFGPRYGGPAFDRWALAAAGVTVAEQRAANRFDVAF